nr:PREDICTED: pleckstrin homology domain-containing family G member 3 isoform X6 [Lepisosteus oculatus]
MNKSKEKAWGLVLKPDMVEIVGVRSVWEDRNIMNGINKRISRWFGGLTGSLLYKFVVKPTQVWFVESPRLSTASSISSNERMSTATISECSASVSTDFSDTDRPVSLVSTLSSGSSRDGQSLYGSTAALTAAASASGSTEPTPAADDDIDLELSPTGIKKEQQAEGMFIENTEKADVDLWSSRSHNHNNNAANKAGAESPRQAPLSPFAAKAMAPNPKLTYVDRVVMEIIETERMYVRDLRSIVEDYLAHIIDTSDLPIRPEQVCALFGNIEDIYEFNSELLQSLDMCDNDPVAVARCFVHKSDYFDIYTQYCTNYPNSVAALTECMRSKTLAKFFRERQASLKRSLPLGSYLLKPVQRILKYHLLLQEIARHFDPEEEGYEVVEEAIYTMTGVAWYINDMKRKHEHAVRLQEIQSLLINWKGPDLTTYGELVLEGTFRVHRAKNERTLFLFDKTLLITKKRGEHYVYKTHITCSTLMLIESAKDSLSFSVTHYKHPKQPHTVQARTVEEKRLWTHHIKRLILENHHAIIPQKAKEAILEMDSIYPSKYKYSPERLKKAMSCQSDDFPGGGRQGRRQSEPTKQIIKSTKALLKDEEGSNIIEENGLKRQNSQSSGQEDLCGSLERKVQPPAEEEQLQNNVAQSENVDKCIEDHPSDLETAGIPDLLSKASLGPEDTAGEDMDEVIEEITEESLPHERREEAKTLSSGESSEEEEEETAIEHDSDSILPPSVLDQASIIAERFVSNLSRRSSLIAEDVRSLGCPSPRLTSRSSSVLSLEASEKAQKLNSACSEPPLNMVTQDSVGSQGTASQDIMTLSPNSDNLFDVERPSFRRRDSTLSKQDRLLIDKIKNYYEHAEHQDASFSIKRRESLTYIPAGLVRNSVCRFNSIPKDDPVPAPVTVKKMDSTACKAGDIGSRPASWTVFDLPATERDNKPMPLETETERSVNFPSSQSKSHNFETLITDEEFKPSTEMVTVWQEMEKELNSTPGKPQSSELKSTEGNLSRGVSPKVLRKGQISNGSADREYGEPLMILEESDLSTITEESCVLSPDKISPTIFGLERKGSVSETNQVHDESTGARVSRAPVPRIIHLRSGIDEETLLQDMEKVKNKVFHLARQYSQRIKSTRPVVRPRGREGEGQLNKRNLPSVQEEKLEKENKEKPVLTLALSSSDQVVLQEMSPTLHARSPVLQYPCPARTSSCSPVRSPASAGGSPRILSPSRARSKSPLSPVQSESFNWPDVRELRSKYASRGTDRAHPKQLPVGRSCSVPEKMLESSVCCPEWRRSSYSASTSMPPDARGRTASASTSESWDCRAPQRDSGEGQSHPHARVCRTGSLDHRIGGLQLSEIQKPRNKDLKSTYYVSGEATLPNEQKVIVIEKMQEKESDAAVSEPGEVVEADDSFVQIRSPTTREKISIMAVIERCKAYQESEEYRQREEGSKTDQATEFRKAPSSSMKKTESSQQSLVKNLREKFQNLSSNP